jgi:hypothetical protein
MKNEALASDGGPSNNRQRGRERTELLMVTVDSLTKKQEALNDIFLLSWFIIITVSKLFQWPSH